jgi:ATP-dependent Clp protease protease subunit
MFKKILMTAALSFSGLAHGGNEEITLTPTNHIVLRGEIDSQSVSKTIHAILSSKEQELILFINSPGGSVMAGRQLVQVLRTTDKKVTCIANVAASMAFVITQGCHKRYVTDSSILMQHVASYGLEGQAPNNLTYTQFLERVLKQLDQFQANRMGLSYKDFKAKTRDDLWLFGEESVQQNAADKVVNVKCSTELAQKTIKEKVQVFIFTVDLEWSGCPLVEYPIKVGADDLKTSPKAQQRLHQLLESYSAREKVLNRRK